MLQGMLLEEGQGQGSAPALPAEHGSVPIGSGGPTVLPMPGSGLPALAVRQPGLTHLLEDDLSEWRKGCHAAPHCALLCRAFLC